MLDDFLPVASQTYKTPDDDVTTHKHKIDDCSLFGGHSIVTQPCFGFNIFFCIFSPSELQDIFYRLAYKCLLEDKEENK
jgi:hypothetical protein